MKWKMKVSVAGASLHVDVEVGGGLACEQVLTL